MRDPMPTSPRLLRLLKTKFLSLRPQKLIWLALSLPLVISLVGFVLLWNLKLKIEHHLTARETHTSYYSYHNELIASYSKNSPSKTSPFYYGEPLPLSEIPLECLQGVMSIEDKSFLTHKGLSWKGLGRALWLNLSKGRWAAGGSTITQQLVKNHFLTPEKTLWRKWKEFWISLVLENLIPKDKILEKYLNIIYMGQNHSLPVLGWKGASLFYFKKEPFELSLKECAFLAGLIQSPGRHNPAKHPARSLRRTDLVLKSMYKDGLISKNRLNEQLEAPLAFSQSRNFFPKSLPHFLDVVKALHFQKKEPPPKVHTSLIPGPSKNCRAKSVPKIEATGSSVSNSKSTGQPATAEYKKWRTGDRPRHTQLHELGLQSPL